MSHKILFVLTPSFTPNAGGVQRTTFKLGKYFNQKGYEIAYFSFALDGHIESRYGKLFHSREPGGVENNENLKYLKEVCLRFKADFVINQMPYEYSLTELLGKIKEEHGFILLGCLRNSLFSVVNNLEASMELLLPRALFPLFNNRVGKKIALECHKYLHRKSLKHILRNHDRYILLSPPNNTELQYFIGDFMQDKVLAIPNSIPKVYDGFEKKEKMILHVGRLNDAQKRSDLLIPFWKACKDRLDDWEFVVVGDGPLLDEMEQQIESENIERIKLTGFQKPEEYYKKASIFMMPSAYEGFPNTILEAQSYGCPVIAFNSYDALDWIVNDGDDAYLIDPYDVEKMADETILLAIDSEKLGKSQKAALQNAAKFTIDKVGVTWEILFHDLTNQELTIENN